MKRSVLTIGYEGVDLADFLVTLSLAGVQHLVDVRDVPVSRKRGFSKTKLADALGDVGIRYTHLKALGDPKDGRDAMKRGDYQRFLNIYRRHIASDDGKRALDVAAEIALEATTVLLCYERNPKECQRTIVAEYLLQRGVSEVRHLGVTAPRRGTMRSNQPSGKPSLVHMPG